LSVRAKKTPRKTCHWLGLPDWVEADTKAVSILWLA
jgi:hypothetical protein